MMDMKIETSTDDYSHFAQGTGAELPCLLTQNMDQYNPQGPHLSLTNAMFYQYDETTSFPAMPRFESFTDAAFHHQYQQSSHSDTVHSYTPTQLHLADLELDSNCSGPASYPHILYSNEHGMAPCSFGGVPSLQHLGMPISPPNSSYHYLDREPFNTPWSSPVYTPCGLQSSTDVEEEAIDEKPYATLIYEALMEAPGRRMMLRDIYDWFRKNTTKAHDSGTNGWQNSIRHNLSMNKAFENDREQGRGSSRKANSVWVLTADAVQNGVQSTTRYRKSGAGKGILAGRTPPVRRERSGTKGGRGVRRSTKYRRQEARFPEPSTPSSCNPGTPSFTDVSDSGLDHHDFQAFRSCPLTPLEGPAQLMDQTRPYPYFAPLSSTELDPLHTTYSPEAVVHLQTLVPQPDGNDFVSYSGDMHLGCE